MLRPSIDMLPTQLFTDDSHQLVTYLKLFLGVMQAASYLCNQSCNYMAEDAQSIHAFCSCLHSLAHWLEKHLL